jgi:sigma-B regulation protein RsbU (phosphoserine phosphatase)
MFVTLFMGVLDLETGRLLYSNAGHESPVILSDGEKKLECVSNVPLGVDQDWEYALQETTLSNQTTLFLYTDGLTEAMDPEQRLFGKKRMMEELKKRQSPEEISNSMTKAVTRFMEGAEQSDDLTMLIIRYNREKQPVNLSRSLTLPNDVQTTPKLAAFVDDVCNTLGFNSSQTLQMNLAVEEAVVNVMNYAYPKGTVGDVQIDASANDERLKFIISDSGMPFDPTARPDTDTSLPADERPIGGLGIHLVRHYMDSVNYERMDERNIFTLRKSIKS